MFCLRYIVYKCTHTRRVAATPQELDREMYHMPRNTHDRNIYTHYGETAQVSKTIARGNLQSWFHLCRRSCRQDGRDEISILNMARPHKLARQLLEEICNPDSTYVDDHVVRMEEILSFMGRVGICCEQSTSRRQTQKYRRMQQSVPTFTWMMFTCCFLGCHSWLYGWSSVPPSNVVWS
jgi:hypothetical protein